MKQHSNIPKIRRKLINICDQLCSIDSMVTNMLLDFEKTETDKTEQGKILRKNVSDMLEKYKITINSVPK